jgi:hypothetical protein
VGGVDYGVELRLAELLGEAGGVLDSTPPVAVILITSAPACTCWRTARRQSSGPEHTDGGPQQGVDVAAEAVGVAVPAVDGDRRSRRDDARSDDLARGDRLAQGEHRVVVAAEIGDGGEPRLSVFSRSPRRPSPARRRTW